ncbi:hypothetical protein [Embleya sp. NPDC005971]
MGEHNKPPAPQPDPPQPDPKQKQDGVLPGIGQPGPGRRKKDKP